MGEAGPHDLVKMPGVESVWCRPKRWHGLRPCQLSVRVAQGSNPHANPHAIHGWDGEAGPHDSVKMPGVESAWCLPKRWHRLRPCQLSVRVALTCGPATCSQVAES